jgi:hypothetical protein
VLRPLSGPDFITDLWSDVQPPTLENSFGVFKLLRVVPAYLLYAQVSGAMTT